MSEPTVVKQGDSPAMSPRCPDSASGGGASRRHRLLEGACGYDAQVQRLAPKDGREESPDHGRERGSDDVPPIDLGTMYVYSDEQRQEFLNACSQATSFIQTAGFDADAWLSSIASAYAIAWQTHTETLKAQEAKDRLVGDLVMGAVLAFAPGGVGGEVGAALKGLAGPLLIDGLKDLTKWTTRRIGTDSFRPAGPSAMKAFPTDPTLWGDLVTVRLKTELGVASRCVEGWQEAMRLRKNVDLNFDPVDRIRSSLTIRGVSLHGLKAVDREAVSARLETGMWKAWLERYGHSVGPALGTISWVRANSNVGSAVRDRLTKLGIAKEALAWASVSKEAAEAEATRRNDASTGSGVGRLSVPSSKL